MADTRGDGNRSATGEGISRRGAADAEARNSHASGLVSRRLHAGAAKRGCCTTVLVRE